MQDAEPKVRSAISRLLEAGFQISPETLEMLKEHKNPQKIVEEFLADNTIHPGETPVLKPEHFDFKIKPKEEPETVEALQPIISSKKIHAEDVKADIQIIKNPAPELASHGKINDFIENFRDRYFRLKSIITQRIDGKGIIDISEIRNISSRNESKRKKTIKIVALVTNKVQTKVGNLALELEDPTGSVTAIVQQKEPNLMNKARIVLLDQVVCIEGTIIGSDVLIVKDLFLPDIPVNRKSNRAKENISAVLISDLHFGSRQFLDKVFTRFLKWLQGEEGDGDQVELAGTVKYLIINGDLVDGIGIYPNQLDDLTIHDLDGQFAGLTNILKEIPQHIHVIVAPGNHDGVRTAIPRPAISESYLAPLKDEGLSISSVGCPCQLSIHGVNLLVYHGDSLVDIMGALSQPELEASFVAMREMLRGRHLAPIYGKGTNIIPEPRDWLVIDQVPDILHCGHIHVNSVGSYRKTLIINSGTFQSQTDYQKLIGVEPTPGIIPLVNLQTLNVKTLNFT